MSKKLIVAAALSGTSTLKSMVPAVPETAEEIAADIVRVVKAGASIVHIHVRDENGRATMDTAQFEKAFCATKEAVQKEGLDVIINLTTSGAYGGTAPDALRLGHLEKLKPEMCSFDAGTMNWGCGLVFENPPEFLEKLCKCTAENDIKPEVEIFDAGMMANAAYYAKKGLLKAPTHYQFVLGVLGGLDPNARDLQFLVDRLPEGSTWSVTGIGKGHIPMMLAGLAMGCDGIRVGLEDNIYYSAGVKTTNEELVKRAVELGKLAGREIATAAEAREMLGIHRKSW